MCKNWPPVKAHTLWQVAQELKTGIDLHANFSSFHCKEIIYNLVGV